MKILHKILDYLISVFMGGGTLLLVSLVVSENWNMFFAMIVGMLLGMLVLLVSVMLFISLSTAFELFPVGMVITMFVGMAAGMTMSMGNIEFKTMLSGAIILSLVVQLWIDMYNMKLKGDVPVGK